MPGILLDSMNTGSHVLRDKRESDPKTVMSCPLVSICLPNLNTMPFLPERFESIFAQSLESWELVVSDNCSEDGAWEFIQRMAACDSRVSIAQAPREGMYANWNRCIRRATGKYVYIATSDDTMASNCLERLVDALEEHEDCDLAHCTLRTIDAKGTEDVEPKWPDCTEFVHGIPGYVGRRHIRLAPHDGLLHLTGGIVYQSITQLLIRRSLFSRIGYFESRWGSLGDMNWDMKAGLVGNTVHVPDTWASFRVHPTQATATVDFNSADFARKIEEMIQDAVAVCRPYLHPAVAAGLDSRWLVAAKDVRDYYRELRIRQSRFSRRLYQIGQVARGTTAVRSELIAAFAHRSKWPDAAPDTFREWLESLGLRTLVPCD